MIIGDNRPGKLSNYQDDVWHSGLILERPGARIMTIRYNLVNHDGGADADNISITGSNASNGVITLTPVPVTVGDLFSGAFPAYRPLAADSPAIKPGGGRRRVKWAWHQTAEKPAAALPAGSVLESPRERRSADIIPAGPLHPFGGFRAPS